jgi:hypothetical protein
VRPVKGTVKSILVIFFDIKGIVHKEFVLAGHTVNSPYYCDSLRRLHENVQRMHLTKLLTDVDKLLMLLISCQNPHKFRGDTMHAQFSSQNPLACPKTNSDLTSKVFNGSTSILTNELLKLSTVLGTVELMRLSALVVLNGCPTDPEPRMPCMAHAFSPNTHLINAFS